jgi:hypothetical protein
MIAGLQTKEGDGVSSVLKINDKWPSNKRADGADSSSR